MSAVYKVKIQNLPKVPNVCRQILREAWQLNKKASIAHVVMSPGSTSLLHKHRKFVEIYYILSGQGKMWVGNEVFNVKKDTLIEIPVNTSHKLKNSGKSGLAHLVICVPAFNPKDIVLIKNRK